MKKTAAVLGICVAALSGRSQDGPAPDERLVMSVSVKSEAGVWEAAYRFVRPGGAEIGLTKGIPATRIVRATPSGTVLACRLEEPAGYFEFDRDGKVLWEATLQDPGDHDLLGRLCSAELLLNGNVLAAGSTIRRDGNVSRMTGAAVVEADSKGKVLRRLDLGKIPTYVLSARPSGADAVLVTGGSVREVSWTGKVLLELKMEPGERVSDALKLPNGNYLLAIGLSARPTDAPEGAFKFGRVAERTPDGKEVWGAFHGCPSTLQRLPSGNILVGAG